MTIVYVREIDPSIRCDNLESYTPMVPHIVFEFQKHDGNNMGLFFSPPFRFTPERREEIYTFIKNNLKDENTQIYFDNMWEGHVLTPVSEIHRFVKDLELNPKKCFFFTSGLQAHEMYNDYCVSNNISANERIQIRVVNLWEYLTRKSCQITSPVFRIEKKEKLFLCFNRMNRIHRTALLGLLQGKNLVDRAYYSFFVPAYGETNTLEDMFLFLKSRVSAPTFNQIKKNLQDIYPKLPLRVNIAEQGDNVNYVKADDQQFVENSYFSLVTETFFFPGTFDGVHEEENSVFFSEKIFKPIICKHPFIAVTRPHSLQYLRKLGYKTFHPFINETYDTIIDDEQRLQEIVAEVERLSKQTDEQWIDWLTNIQAIVEHNYDVIMNKSKSEFVFNEL